MSVIYKNGKYYGQEGGGSASFPPGGDAGQALVKNSATDDDVKWGNPEAGRAKSSAIAPIFDEETTYTEGDRVTYEDELYVFNKAHTGAWDAADADKSDVDSEIPEAMSASDLQDVKDAFSGMNKGAPLRMMNYSTEEQVVGTWIDGKPLYQKTFYIGASITTYATGLTNIDNVFIEKQQINVSNNYVYESYYYDSTAWAYACVKNDGSEIVILKSSQTVLTGSYITLQYTKTTD